MATIYRFEVIGGGSGNGKTKGVATKKAEKTKGVEFNRYRRITTTIGNKATGGLYSRGVRLAKAGSSLISTKGSSFVAWAIIVQTIINILQAWDKWAISEANRYNSADFKKLEVGKTRISNNFNSNVNFLTGRVSYKENR